MGVVAPLVAHSVGKVRKDNSGVRDSSPSELRETHHRADPKAREEEGFLSH